MIAGGSGRNRRKKIVSEIYRDYNQFEDELAKLEKATNARIAPTARVGLRGFKLYKIVKRIISNSKLLGIEIQKAVVPDFKTVSQIGKKLIK